MKASILLPIASSLSIALAQTPKNCPLLGPIYPSPTNIFSSSSFQSALSNFSTLLPSILASESFDNETTSFSLSVFSASTNATLYTHHYKASGLNDSLPSGKLNGHTIYRVGSVSKLFTVYTLLAQAGDKVLNDPITKYVPELDDGSEEVTEALDSVRWSEVTVGALASHMAGISRSYSLYDLAILSPTGLPPIDPTFVPTCGITPGNQGVAPCNRTELLSGLKSQKPLTSTFNTPIYSNSGFTLLSYVIESLTNQTFDQAIQSILFDPLNLTRSSITTPNDTNIIVMPEFAQQFGIDGSAAGGIYSTLSDLSTLGQSILRHTLLSPSSTRRWMKPHSHTADPFVSVGAPWEIVRTEIPIARDSTITRVVDLYTKAGDIDGYSSVLALSPDHDIGFAVLTAGKSASVTRNIIGSLLAKTFVSAADEAGRELAEQNYVGNYTIQTEEFYANLTLAVDEKPGLALALSANGTDFRVLLAGALGDAFANASVRLYPSGLKSKDGKRIKMTAIFDVAKEVVDGVFERECESWLGVGALQYGGAGLDEFEVGLGQDGKVENITSLGFRGLLIKAE